MWRIVIDEDISDGLQSVEMFNVLNELASKKRDRTEAMMLAERRSSTFVEDENLGLVAASTALVTPSSIDDGYLDGPWKIWWQKAVEKVTSSGPYCLNSTVSHSTLYLEII